MQLQQILLIALTAGSIAGCNSKEEKKAAPEVPTPTTEPAPKDTTAPEPKEPTEPTPAIGDTPPGHHAKATAMVEAASGSKVSGTVEFTTLTSTKLKVDLALEGLTPGEHGFHIHETGDCSSADAKSAGGHFNPSKVDHGDPSGEAHHAGDFGNITADENGKAKASWEVNWISLQQDADIGVVNRAVVVHKDADDMKSQPSGNAGARVGCGVIKAPQASE